jgi:pectinesterase
MPAAGSTRRCPSPGNDGKPLGAESSSTVTVESDYFIANGVMFRNGAVDDEVV